MSRLAELIERLCPDGVEYKPLGEVCIMERGKSVTRQNVTEGDIPVISGGQKPAYFCDTPNRTGETITVAGSGANAGIVMYWNTPIFVCDAFSVKAKEDCLTKYIYYFLNSQQNNISATKKGAGVPHVHIKNIEKFLIPVPPIEVQEEIVRILDKFTTLEAELEAELDCRKRQYQYYRDKLLTFSELGNGGGKMMSLNELLRYEQPAKYIVHSDDYIKEGIPVLTAGQTFILGYTDETDGIYHANKDNPVIIFDDFTTSFHWVEFDFKVKSSAMKMLRPTSIEIRFRYVYYAMQFIRYETLEHSRQWISKYSNIQIPVPPLEEQQRIVSILDRFESLTTDICEGLPAEIKARHQQYEYYRDKLLTFKQIPA